METLGDLSNWAARRLARSLLRKTRLQQILATDLDFEQISVQLAKGSLELKGFLLDTKYLNEQLVSQCASPFSKEAKEEGWQRGGLPAPFSC